MPRSPLSTARLRLTVVALSAAATLLYGLRTESLAGTQMREPPPRELAVIVNRANPVERLSRRDLRRIFLLDTQTWPSGRKITVVLREKGQAERAEAISIICDMREADFDRHVLFQTFGGAVTGAPRSIRSAAAMLRFVFNAPGAIGYVYADEVDDSAKVLRIDDLLPGQPDYPLRPAARRRERRGDAF